MTGNSKNGKINKNMNGCEGGAGSGKNAEGGPVRINKYLAMAGVCSRREADRLIAEGSVLIDGQKAVAGVKVTGFEDISVLGKKVSGRCERCVIAFYKPEGVVCTHSDIHAERTVFDIVKDTVRVTYAGRLDKDSEGLLLLTNDGSLIQRLMKGSNGHEKEYLVTVDKDITGDFSDRMEKGIYLPKLDKTTKPCKVRITGDRTFDIVLTQGLNRQIRRMCSALGYRVTSLKRIRIENVTLDGLGRGEYRILTPKEVGELYKRSDDPIRDPDS